MSIALNVSVNYNPFFIPTPVKGSESNSVITIMPTRISGDN